jgi:hypothetical protein
MARRFRSSLVVAMALGTLAPVHAAASLSPSDTAALSSRLADLPDGPGHRVIDAALDAYARAVNRGAVSRIGLLTVIDYTLPSTSPRLWVLDLAVGRVVYRELVAHGRGSGDNFARRFSNTEGSWMSSLGLFVTDRSYLGRNGYSLRLRGLDPGLNDQAYARAIVLHGAQYVSEAVIARLGRLGRSLGCPAVRSTVARQLIDTIKGGTVLFAYGAGV